MEFLSRIIGRPGSSRFFGRLSRASLKKGMLTFALQYYCSSFMAKKEGRIVLGEVVNLRPRDDPGFSCRFMCVYVLQSENDWRYYYGQTSNVGRHLSQHIGPAHRETKTTKRFEGTWKLVLFQKCPNRSKAQTLEKKVKKRGILRFLQDQMGGEN